MMAQQTAPSASYPTLSATLPRMWAAIATPCALFLLSRAAIVLIAYVAAIVLPIDPNAYHLRGTDNLLLDVFGSRWDTGFYVSIAENGYQPNLQPFPNTPFFPLLPLLMKTLMVGDAVVSGIIIVNVALLIAVICFYQLVKDEWGAAIATRAVWYLLIFPTSFFGSAIYTESLFLATVIGALLAARRGHWWLAGILGALTAATRLVGIIVLPMLFFEWLINSRARHWSTVIAIGLPVLGTGSFMAYLWQAFGDPIAFIHASAEWGRIPQSPAVTIQRLLEHPIEGWGNAISAGTININDWIDLAMVLVFLIAGFVLLYEHRWSEGIFVWLGVLIPFSSGLLMSQRRYVWVLFPVFILLARLGVKRWVDQVIVVLSLCALALNVASFASGVWVG